MGYGIRDTGIRDTIRDTGYRDMGYRIPGYGIRDNGIWDTGGGAMGNGIQDGGAKLKVRFASPAGLKAGRSVGSFRLNFLPPRCARRVGRSGQPESVADALSRQGGSVGRVIPTQFFAAALRAAVGRSG